MSKLAWPEAQRKKRRFDTIIADQRTPFERDRDRLLYSSAFFRLSGVTQVVRADEADIFHNRLTHSNKVAQLGRRMAQNLLNINPAASRTYGLDPEVVEAASLAHDLGHPPFGHLAEKVLDKLVRNYGDDEGFEGNAQSFRVVTKLGVRSEDHDGLDLTSATLAAIIKYPWYRDPKSVDKRAKWGAYRSETEDFEFARGFWSKNYGEVKTAEAELMDWADDIAYSIHDLEDFHRARLIPWHLVSDQNHDHCGELIKAARSAWHRSPKDAERRLMNAHARIFSFIKALDDDFLRAPYEGLRTQRYVLRLVTSQLVGRYIVAITLKDPEDLKPEEPVVHIDADFEDELRVLKQITRYYVIANPSLAAQQKGYGRIIEELFEDIIEGSSNRTPTFLPKKFLHIFEIPGTSTARATADCISSLTEREAIALHQRLRGATSGSVWDPIVR